ncbi:hypothetical protein PVAP13_1KG057077 [Panicum virgatum]|uniref:Uncharacterized protein n=1 Tax=Panicum virgatum TaxID=38727 RepID=A0A8T0XAR2_PANVG|nr:hypothetical protein PVAP13_1KG057077 [Panicum virgatum]
MGGLRSRSGPLAGVLVLAPSPLGGSASGGAARGGADDAQPHPPPAQLAPLRSAWAGPSRPTPLRTRGPAAGGAPSRYAPRCRGPRPSRTRLSSTGPCRRCRGWPVRRTPRVASAATASAPPRRESALPTSGSGQDVGGSSFELRRRGPSPVSWTVAASNRRQPSGGAAARRGSARRGPRHGPSPAGPSGGRPCRASSRRPLAGVPALRISPSPQSPAVWIRFLPGRLGSMASMACEALLPHPSLAGGVHGRRALLWPCAAASSPRRGSESSHAPG